METLTKDDIDKAGAPHYVDTQYGRKMGLKRLTNSAFMRAQALFARPILRDDGSIKDPLGVSFQDVECPACCAAERKPCERFGDESVPHEGRIDTAAAVRAARGNRMLLAAAIVDPPMDTAGMEFLEGNQSALKHLIGEVLDFLGLSKKAHDVMTETFREGADRPAPVSI